MATAAVNVQDWKTVTLKKAPSKRTTVVSKDRSLSKALAEGKVETVARVPDTQSSHMVASARKIEEAAERGEFKLPSIPHEFRQALQKARVAKKWSQAQLAQQIAVKQSVIADYESGRAVPAPDVIAKLNRALQVKLPKISKPRSTDSMGQATKEDEKKKARRDQE